MAWVVQNEDETNLFSSVFSEDKDCERKVVSHKVEEDISTSVQKGVVEGDRERIKEIFHKWDNDGNGIICRHELMSVMRLLCSVNESDLEVLMNEVDTNGDGEIDYDEFVNWLTRPANKSQGRAIFEHAETLRPIFDAYDVQGTGSISFKEFEECHAIIRGALRRHTTESDSDDLPEVALDPLLLHRDADRAFRHVDANGDKEITFREFVNWLLPAIERSEIAGEELKTFVARMSQMLKGVYKQSVITKEEAGNEGNTTEIEALKLFKINLASTALALEGGLKPKDIDEAIGAVWTKPPVGLCVSKLKATHAKYYPLRMHTVSDVTFSAFCLPTKAEEDKEVDSEYRVWLGKVVRTVTTKTGKVRVQRPSFYIFERQKFTWLPLQSEAEIRDASVGAEGARRFDEAMEAMANEMSIFHLFKSIANFGTKLRWPEVREGLTAAQELELLDTDEVEKFVGYMKATAQTSLYDEGVLARCRPKEREERVSKFLEGSIVLSPEVVMETLTDLGIVRANVAWSTSKPKQ